MSYEQEKLEGVNSGDIQNAIHTYAPDAEASDAYAIALDPAITAYLEGQTFIFKANTANTGASSLNVNGVGAITLKKSHDQDTETGDIESGSIVEVTYDGTNFQILSVSALPALTEVGFTDLDTDLNDAMKMGDGAVLDTPTITVTATGGVITLGIQKSGGGNIRCILSGAVYEWVTAPDTVVLTAGTDASPQINYIYLLESNKTLTVSTVGFPSSGGYVPVATVMCQSANTLETDGAYKVHAWTDHLAADNNNGHLSHLNQWVRHQFATWISGVTLTPTIGIEGALEDTVDISTSAGVILQLHDHTFPTFDTAVSSDVYLVNKNGANYTKITDLNSADEDDAGNAITTNKWTNLVIWGVVSEETGDCKLFINLPSGFYGSATGATLDTEKKSNYNIPAGYKGTGFLIARLTLKYTTGASGTWTLEENLDLRGQFPSTFAGGNASIATEFLDSVFRINDDTDETKQIDFQASGITTGTKRTITMPDKDVDLDDIYVPRVSSEASSATPTINTDNVDFHSITALALAITSMTTNLSGTPTNGQKLIIRIKDDGTARAIAWGASFIAMGVDLPTTTTISKVLTVGFIYDTVNSKWGCVASVEEA